MIFKTTGIVQWTFILILTVTLSSVAAFAGQGQSEYESNDTREKSDSITTAPIIYGNLDNKDRDDWFRILGPLNPKARFSIEAPGRTSFKFTVYRDDKVIGSTSGKKNGEAVVCDITGTVYIHVQRIDGSGNYMLKIQNLPIPKASPVPNIKK